MMNLVDVRGHAARAEIVEADGIQFQGSSSFSSKYGLHLPLHRQTDAEAKSTFHGACVERQPNLIIPQDLDQITAAPAEDVEIASMRSYRGSRSVPTPQSMYTPCFWEEQPIILWTR
jgi:hypothetical protein